MIVKKFGIKLVASSVGMLMTGTMAAATTGLIDETSPVEETTTTTLVEETTTTTVVEETTTTTTIAEPTTTTTVLEEAVPTPTVVKPSKEACAANRALEGSHGCKEVAHQHAPGQVKKAEKAHPNGKSKGSSGKGESGSEDDSTSTTVAGVDDSDDSVSSSDG